MFPCVHSPTPILTMLGDKPEQAAPKKHSHRWRTPSKPMDLLSKQNCVPQKGIHPHFPPVKLGRLPSLAGCQAHEPTRCWECKDGLRSVLSSRVRGTSQAKLSEASVCRALVGGVTVWCKVLSQESLSSIDSTGSPACNTGSYCKCLVHQLAAMRPLAHDLLEILLSVSSLLHS